MDVGSGGNLNVDVITCGELKNLKTNISSTSSFAPQVSKYKDRILKTYIVDLNTTKSYKLRGVKI